MRTMLTRFLDACDIYLGWKNSRSMGIIILAFFTFRMTLGYLLFPPILNPDIPVSAVVTALELFLPIWVYGLAWLIVTVALLLSAFLKQDALALGLSSGMNTLWSISYFWDFVMEGTRAWFSGLLYLGLVLLTLVVSKIKNPYALEVARGSDDVYRP